ncbi:hypothetical protein F5Y11DRAFT_101271 [Daldinia sp. FL1419]|nr:hypothetical protein F5Y11DRAFT_101271 [Daldinia sp. FL1419]
MDAAARHVGARLLGEIEEGSLEELLDSLRINLTGGSSNTIRPDIPIPALANIVARYHRSTQSAPPPVLSVSGRYLSLLYHLISTLIAKPHNYTIVIIDAESRFDVTRLVSPNSSSSTGNKSYPAQLSDLHHVYVYRPTQGQDQVRAAIKAAGERMLYGAHGSRAREWWGTVVMSGGSGVGGGASVKGDVNAGWKGWLRVEREEVAGFPAGIGAEEALRDRDKRQEVVEDAGWVAGSRVGSYLWREN